MSDVAELRRIVEDLVARVAALEEGICSLIAPVCKLGFTLQQARFVSILLNREVVSRESFITLLYGLESDQQSDKLVDCHLCHARRKLREFGIELQQVRKVGWHLKPSDKAKLMRLARERLAA